MTPFDQKQSKLICLAVYILPKAWGFKRWCRNLQKKKKKNTAAPMCPTYLEQDWWAGGYFVRITSSSISILGFTQERTHFPSLHWQDTNVPGFQDLPCERMTPTKSHGRVSLCNTKYYNTIYYSILWYYKYFAIYIYVGRSWVRALAVSYQRL